MPSAEGYNQCIIPLAKKKELFLKSSVQQMGIQKQESTYSIYHLACYVKTFVAFRDILAHSDAF